MKWGSVESWKVSARCGARPKVLQMTETRSLEIPSLAAILRVLQRVAFFGLASRVRRRTSATLSSHGGAGRSAPRGVGQTGDALRGVALAPCACGGVGKPHALSNLLVIESIGAEQDGPGAPGLGLGSLPRLRHADEFASLALVEHPDGRGDEHCIVARSKDRREKESAMLMQATGGCS